MNTIFLFSLKGCPFCSDVKKFLKQKNVKFYVIDIEENDVIWRSVVEKTNNEYVPTIFIKKENNENIVLIPDDDFKSVDELYNLILLHTKNDVN